jgi:tetratricopeptide (TPR) repeat protein
MQLEGRCLSMLERTAEAHHLYMRLSQLNPGDPTVWIEFAAVAWEVGDLRRVAQASVRAISIAPDRFEGYMLKGLYEQEKGRHDEAIELFRDAAERAPRSLAPHLLLGRALESAGEPEQALAAYRRALDIRPDDVEAQALYRTVELRIRLAEVESTEVRQRP